MVLFHLFFLLCMTIRPKIKVHTDLFLYMYTTIRPKIRVLIDLFFYLRMTIRRNYRVLFHLLFLQCMTIRPKIRVFNDIYLSFAHDHSTKIYYLLSLIYSFFVHNHSTKNQCPNTISLSRHEQVCLSGLRFET